MVIEEILTRARSAVSAAPSIDDPAYQRFTRCVGDQLMRHWPDVAAANTADLARGRSRGLPSPLIERMRLTAGHRDALVALTHRVRAELAAGRPPGLEYRGIGEARARRIAKPLGVVLFIYEARPTVTVDGTLLAVCAGNAVLLRGGSETGATDAALACVISDAARDAGLPLGIAQVLPRTSRAELRELLGRDDMIDVVIPRGGPSLIDFCRRSSRIPLITGGGGVNHLYIHESADLDLAVNLVLDSKLPEPAGCTALEMVLLDEQVVDGFFASLAGQTAESGVEGLMLALCPQLHDQARQKLHSRLASRPLIPGDYGREFMDHTLAVRAVRGLDEAVAHIRAHGSQHTEGVVTDDPEVADEFCRRVDAAGLVVNGSLRLHDGPSLGIGTEIAISTGRLHVRGPVTLNSLMTYSWRVDGHGAVRFRSA